MFLKKKNRRIPVSMRVTGLYSIVIIGLVIFGLSAAFLLEDKYVNQKSTEELVEAVEEIYENPDKFENFDDGIYCIKYNENKTEEAIEYALKAKDYITNDDNKVHVYSYLAWMYDKIEAYDIAEDLLKSILNCQTDQRNEVWAYSELGYCLGEQHRYEESLEALIKASEMGRDDIWINSQIGWTFRILGKYEEALEYLFKAKELGRDDDWINAELGICYKEIDKFEEALQSYLVANEQNGQSSIWVLSEIAWLYGVLDKFNDELKYLDLVKKLGRKDEWIWSRVANIYFDLERYKDALDAYSKAYKLAKNSWYICNIGRSLRRLGKYEEAVKKLIQSRKLSLKEGDVVDLEDLELAYCYAALGDKKKAEKHMKLSMDSLGTRAVNEEHLKKQFDEIKEMISVLSKPS